MLLKCQVAQSGRNLVRRVNPGIAAHRPAVQRPVMTGGGSGSSESDSRCCNVQPPSDVQTSSASNVISAVRTLETGQFFSASLAKRVNVASSMFGTLARNDRAERLMRKP